MKKVYRSYRKKILTHLVAWMLAKEALLLVTLLTGQGEWALGIGQLLFGVALTGIGEGLVMGVAHSLTDSWFRRKSFLFALSGKLLVSGCILFLLNLIGLTLFDGTIMSGINLLSVLLVHANPALSLIGLGLVTASLHTAQRITEITRCAACDWTCSHPAFFSIKQSAITEKNKAYQVTSENITVLTGLAVKQFGISTYTALSSIARKGILSLMLMLPLAAIAQERHEAIRIIEENDWFTGTDRYYSNGARIEWLFEGSRTLPGDHLLIAPSGYDSKVRGLGVVQAMYTPSNTSVREAIRNDRPYAGTLYINSFLETFQEAAKLKVRSELSVGTLGPKSYAKETQTWFHQAINDDIPQGWDHQVGSTFLLNYGLRIEKGLFASQRAEVIGVSGFNFGTAQTDATLGAILRIGILDRYFSSRLRQSGPVTAFVFLKPSFILVIDNQTIEGRTAHGQEDSSNVSINNGVWRYDYGFAINAGRTSLTYAVVNTSPEFSGAGAHRYGSVAITVQLF